MGWREIQVGKEIDHEPDGKPFIDPIDTFETHYNAQLKKYGKKAVEYVDENEGFPLSTRLMERRPEGSPETRSLMDWFFQPYLQATAIENGNTHEELDKIAKELLLWAVLFSTPMTDSERRVADRLGVKTEGCPKLDDTKYRYHSSGL